MVTSLLLIKGTLYIIIKADKAAICLIVPASYGQKIEGFCDKKCNKGGKCHCRIGKMITFNSLTLFALRVGYIVTSP